jgi:hypothetical protein
MDALNEFTCTCRGDLRGQDGKTCPFEDQGDGTVKDTEHNIVWQKQYTLIDSWDQATQYCSMLTLRGGGWRLPAQTEVYSPMYWPDPGLCFAYDVAGNFGCNIAGTTNSPDAVRCVR